MKVNNKIKPGIIIVAVLILSILCVGAVAANNLLVPQMSNDNTKSIEDSSANTPQSQSSVADPDKKVKKDFPKVLEPKLDIDNEKGLRKLTYAEDGTTHILADEYLKKFLEKTTGMTGEQVDIHNSRVIISQEGTYMTLPVSHNGNLDYARKATKELIPFVFKEYDPDKLTIVIKNYNPDIQIENQEIFFSNAEYQEVKGLLNSTDSSEIFTLFKEIYPPINK